MGYTGGALTEKEAEAEVYRIRTRYSRCLAIVLCCLEADLGEEEARWEVVRLVALVMILRPPARWGSEEAEGGCWS